MFYLSLKWIEIVMWATIFPVKYTSSFHREVIKKYSSIQPILFSYTWIQIILMWAKITHSKRTHYPSWDMHNKGKQEAMGLGCVGWFLSKAPLFSCALEIFTLQGNAPKEHLWFVRCMAFFHKWEESMTNLRKSIDYSTDWRWESINWILLFLSFPWISFYANREISILVWGPI